ncbi:hypothetical protein SMB34_19320 [Thalassospira permensis NBRC 106175]|uniref:Uncharacterized protein n=1 Tax=Thalassospira permensis NBRC 106175 TaxID=1353532 RepID=A0ABR4TMU0_9PROT|nr:hypothetical protein SMB34_19320 [Thalassospira permensis NBRC 106175]
MLRELPERSRVFRAVNQAIAKIRTVFEQQTLNAQDTGSTIIQISKTQKNRAFMKALF